MDLEQQRQRLKREIVQAYRLFVALGWGDMGDGHISGRDPELRDCFWLLDADVPFSEANEDHLVLIDESGKIAAGSGTINRPAYFIHAPILKARNDIDSVAHTHTPYGTPFSSQARCLQPITQEACVFLDDHAVFDDEEVQVQSTECGDRIAKSLKTYRGLILRNHGLLTVGKNPRESLVWFVMMERVAEAHIKARNVQPISHNAALFAKADLVSDAQVSHTFNNLVSFHLS